MRTKLGSTLSVAALVAMMAACGGGGGGSTPGASAGAPTDAPTETSGGGAATSEATSEATAGAPAGALDVCAMLTPAEVKGVVGVDVTGAVEQTSWADWVAGECWWSSADMKVRFSVDVGTRDSIAKSSSPTAREQLDLDKIAYQGFGKIEDVGLGDASIFVAGFVVVVKGDKLVELYAPALDKAKAVALAKLVVDKM